MNEFLPFKRKGNVLSWLLVFWVGFHPSTMTKAQEKATGSLGEGIREVRSV